MKMAILKALTVKNDVMVVFAGEHNPEIYTPLLTEPHNAFGLAFMIKHDGKHGVQIAKGKNDADVLTLETMVDFLHRRTSCVTTKNWIMQND